MYFNWQSHSTAHALVGVQGILGLLLTMHRWNTILPLPVALPNIFLKLNLGFPRESWVSPPNELVCLSAFIPASLISQLHPLIRLNPSPFSFPFFTKGKGQGSFSLFLVAQLVKTLPANAGDVGLIPGSGKSPGEENGNPLQYSCLGNSKGRGALWAIAHGVTKSKTRLSN